MRIFWGLMLVLVLGAAGYLYGKLTREEAQDPPVVAAATTPEKGGGSAAPVEAPEAPPVEAAEPPPPAATDPVPTPASAEPRTDSEPLIDSASLDAMLGTLTGAPPLEDASAEETAQTTSDAQPEVDAVAAAPESTLPEPRPTSSDDSASVAAGVVPEAEPVAIEAVPATAAPESPASSAPAAPKFAGYEVIPVSRTVRDDGSLLLDDLYPLSGKGTEAEPYKVSWDLLTSSSQTLAPRQGKKKLPERVTMLDGKWVELSGYVAFPLMVQEADELLLMLNQWDGCCIGVPPTPYDAIEVSLTKKVKGQDRFAVQGSIKGRLGVKPHLVGEWLVGIYVMDQASLSTKAVGGFAQ